MNVAVVTKTATPAQSCQTVRRNHFKMIKGDIFEGMLNRSRYFGWNAESNTLFKPELEVSQKINDYVAELNTLRQENAEYIIQTFNQIENKEHFDGSGWHDYKLHLRHLLKVNGFDVELDGNKTMRLTHSFKQ